LSPFPNSSIVFFALANRIFYSCPSGQAGFSTNLAAAHFFTLWCIGNNNAAMQTNASNINTGE
jgi:hypothetical protein